MKLESKIGDVSKDASIGSRYMGKVDLSAGSKEGFRVALEGDGKLSLFYFELKELLGLKIIFF